MTVRAKFRLNSYTTELQPTYPYKTQSGQAVAIDYSRPVNVEKRTLNFTPVVSGSEENKKFWEYTPSGSLQLGVVNQEVWALFEIGKEYYLDFTPA